MSYSSTKSFERLQVLAKGVADRGALLSEGWRCEVYERKNGEKAHYDVYYYSPEGQKLRSDPEVYRHLDIQVTVASQQPGANKNETRQTGGKLKRAAQGTDQQSPSPAATHENLKLIYDFDTKDLPPNLQQVPIRCKTKPGVLHLADKRVECTDAHCTICLGKSAADRYMMRSGAHGFCTHSGMPADSNNWASAFKVELPGSEFDGITVESYFKQFGYSIKQPNRRTGANLPLNTPEDVTEEGSILHTPSASPKRAKHATGQAPVNNLMERLEPNTVPSTDPNTTSGAISSLPVHSPAITQPVVDTQAESAAVEAKPTADIAAMQATHATEIAAMRAAHAAEIAAVRAETSQAAEQARALYMQAQDEKRAMQDTMYDLKTSRRPQL